MSPVYQSYSKLSSNVLFAASSHKNLPDAVILHQGDYSIQGHGQLVDLRQQVPGAVIQEEALVVGIIGLTAVAADEFGTPGADGQLGDQDLHFLSLTEGLGAEREQIFQLRASLSGGGLQAPSGWAPVPGPGGQ